MRDLGLDRAVEDTLLKLLAALPPTQRHVAERMRTRIHFDPSGWYFTHQSVPMLDLLHNAVWEDRQLAVTYTRSDGSVTSTTLDPHGLVAKASIWYLVAAKTDGTMRTYRVSRFASVDLLENHFTRQTDFDLAAYWAAGVDRFQMRWPSYPTELRIAPAQSHILEQIMPDRHEMIGVEDEGWVRVKVMFGSIEEARAFVLGMRETVIVETPQELHDTVIEWARQILQFHGELPTHHDA